MRIYSKTGDAGETGLLGGPRVVKNHPRIECCGHVDELNAVIGVARSQRPLPAIDEVLQRVQGELFHLGADLANAAGPNTASPRIAAGHVTRLEGEIDRFEERLPALRQFILPGGDPLASHLHVARGVCRRAERAVVALSQTGADGAEALRYLNRLGDLLFVLARTANREAGVADVVWEP